MATLGEKAVGSIVKLNVNGAAKNFIVVHQGLPGTMYDSSCDGAWLLMEDLYESRAWDSSDSDYANSDIHSYLNNTFVNLLDSDIGGVIKQCKLPYTQGNGTSGSLKTGSNGLSAKVFLLSYTEVGFSGYNANAEGFVLDHFSGAANSKRVAKLNGSAIYWWLRSPVIGMTNTPWAVSSSGASYNFLNATSSRGVRPALILPSEIAVSSGGVIGNSGAITGSVTIGGVQRELTGKGYINIGGVLRELSDSQANIGGTLESLKG